MKVLFCIASQQVAANLHPVAELKPDQVIVAITESMQIPGQTLIDELTPLLGKTNVIPLEITNEASLKALNEQFADWIKHYLDHSNEELDEIIVNITGGTKLMSLAAYQVFKSWGGKCFYCDKDGNQLIWLDDESVIPQIGSNITLENYLRIYNFKVENKHTLAQIPREYKQYAALLHQQLCRPGRYDAICGMVGKINAHTVNPALPPSELKKFIWNHDEREILVQLSQATQVFTLTADGKIAAKDNDARQLMNGGWLEILTADSLRGEGYRDISINVEIAKSTQRAGRSTRQEIDVMAMRDDKLVIIECKTKNWKNTDEASASLYKLAALDDIGGLNTIAKFVSLRNLPPASKTRAAEFNIDIVAGNDVIHLKEHLRQ